MKTAEQIATEVLSEIASKPELLPPSPEGVTWDTPGVGSITIEDFHARITAALKEYGELVRQGAAGVCRTVGRPVGAGDGGTYVPGTSADCAAAIERMELP